MFRHLVDDLRELAGRHVCPLAFLDVPELDEDLAPAFRVRTTADMLRTVV